MKSKSTLDLEVSLWEDLKRASEETGRSRNSILAEAAEDWLEKNGFKVSQNK